MKYRTEKHPEGFTVTCANGVTFTAPTAWEALDKMIEWMQTNV